MTGLKTGDTGFLFDDENPQPILKCGKIRIGTSGYIFRDWQGPFYPNGLPQRRWLEFYARYFTVAEINATYYRILPTSSFEGMARATPDEFTFWVKLPSDATHSLQDPENSIKLFLDSIKPLLESGKLAGLLAQFPPSFRFGRENMEYLKRLQDRTQDLPLAVEFRSDDWCNDELYTFLAESKLIFVIVDLPALPGLPGIDVRTTGNISYARLHGRNATTWYDQGAGNRYDYEYTESELVEWIPRIAKMDEMAPLTFLFFNNCHAGQAVKNARMMLQLLQREFTDDLSK